MKLKNNLMFQWYPKDFEMIVIEKGKFDFDVLECMYEYERRAKKFETDNIIQRVNQMTIFKHASWKNVKQLRVMNGKKTMLKKKKKKKSLK